MARRYKKSKPTLRIKQIEIIALKSVRRKKGTLRLQEIEILALKSDRKHKKVL